jgi:hypothetical protein
VVCWLDYCAELSADGEYFLRELFRQNSPVRASPLSVCCCGRGCVLLYAAVRWLPTASPPASLLCGVRGDSHTASLALPRTPGPWTRGVSRCPRTLAHTHTPGLGAATRGSLPLPLPPSSPSRRLPLTLLHPRPPRLPFPAPPPASTPLSCTPARLPSAPLHPHPHPLPSPAPPPARPHAGLCAGPRERGVRVLCAAGGRAPLRAPLPVQHSVRRGWPLVRLVLAQSVEVRVSSPAARAGCTPRASALPPPRPR